MFLLGFACGVAATAVVAYYLRATRRTQTATPPTPVDVLEPVDTHGHSFDPVAAIEARLPEAPTGCFWEYGIKHNLAGEPELWVGLLSTVTNTIVASKRVNLIWRHKGFGWSWANNYNDYGPEYAGPNAYNALIEPLVLWATAEANKRRGGGGIERYGIKV